MIDYVPALIAFFVSLISIYFLKNYFEKKKIVGENYCTKNLKKIPRSCGIAILVGIWIAVAYIEIQKLDFGLIAFAILITLFSLVGFFDDLKNKWTSKTPSWLSRAIPIGIISLAFAFIYSPSIIWILPITLYIAGLASFQNTFAGLNGWEVGSGLILLITATLITQNYAIGLILIAGTFALLLFNKWPAKVFPGDSGTLLIGAGIAGLFVMTQNIYLIILSLLLFLPHIIDYFVLKKLISKAKDATQAKIMPYKVMKDNKIYIADYPKGKIQWDFAKMIMKIFGPLFEWQIVIIILFIVIVNSLIFGNVILYLI